MAKLKPQNPPPFDDKDPDGRRRALVFCANTSVARQMAQQMEKRNFLVWMVTSEERLLVRLEESDPQLILIDLFAPTKRRLDAIVSDVFKWMRGRARTINKLLGTPNQFLWEHSRVVLFKSDEEMSPAGSLATDIADIDEMIRLCSLAGNVRYIGLFSPLSFISKIRPFWD